MKGFVRPTLTPAWSPFPNVEMFYEHGGRYYARSKRANAIDVQSAAQLLENLSKPGRLEAVRQFLQHLDSLEQ